MPTPVVAAFRPHRFPLAVAIVALSACSLTACKGDGSADSGLAQNSEAVDPNAGGTTDPNAGTPNTALPPVAQAPNGPAIAFHGRFDTVTDPNVPTMSWPGSEIVFGFRGTKLTATLAAPDPSTYAGVTQGLYVAYAVDGGPTQTLKLNTGKTAYDLAKGLPTGQHTVRLAKMSEAQFGRVMFYGATTDGAMTYTSPVPTRRLEFVGDSGTAGYGVLGTYPCTFSAATESGDAAYPALVGRLLGADVHNISFSGKGLVQNRDMAGDAYKTMPILWQRTMAYDDPYLLWDTNQWRPQAVIAVISGNDVYTSIPSQAVFVQKIRDFATALRTAYPQAVLYFGASPMLRTNDPHTGQRATAISYLQTAIAQANDPNVKFIDLPQDNGFNGTNCVSPDCPQSDPNCMGTCFGCDDHMYPPTQALVAQTIATVLKKQLGW